jgi:hypothetical protein
MRVRSGVHLRSLSLAVTPGTETTDTYRSDRIDTLLFLQWRYYDIDYYNNDQPYSQYPIDYDGPCMIVVTSYGYPFRAIISIEMSNRNDEMIVTSQSALRAQVFPNYIIKKKPILEWPFTMQLGFLYNLAIVHVAIFGLTACFTGLKSYVLRKRGACTTCGYSLVGIRANECPECGSQHARQQNE